jgi:hypothetical protein
MRKSLQCEQRDSPVKAQLRGHASLLFWALLLGSAACRPSSRSGTAQSSAPSLDGAPDAASRIVDAAMEDSFETSPRAGRGNDKPAMELATTPSGEYLVWTRGANGSDSESTWWITSGPSGFAVKGRADGVFIATATGIWQWGTREVQLRTQCDQDLNEIPRDGGTASISGFVQNMNHAQRVFVEPDILFNLNTSGPLQCMVVMHPAIELLGSVAGLLFIHGEYHEYSGGAHGLTHREFLVWDLVRQSPWPWGSIAVSESVKKAIRKELGDGHREGPDAEPWSVEIEPAEVEPDYEPDGKLVLRVCFRASSDNQPDIVISQSKGDLTAGNCARASIPESLRPNATAPRPIATFMRQGHSHIKGWSAIPVMTIPDSLRALFVTP